MKKITVIIPCYNVEKYIDRCLRSIKNQTIGIDCLEIICIDDGSTDRTFEFIKAWEQKYPDNILIIQLQKNSSQSTARNVGLSFASCDYLAFIDADDWIESHYLEKMYDIAVSSDYDIVQCKYSRDTLDYSGDSTSKHETVAKGHSELIEDVQSRKLAITHKTISSNAPMKLIKKSLLTDNNISFNDGLRYEDIAFGLLLTMYAHKVYLLDEKLYHYCVNEQSTVLKKNESYHTDLLKNWEILWNDLHERGLFEEYKDEFELEFVYSCIMIFWKVMAYRFDEPPYSHYELLSNLAKSYIPDIMDNHYVKNNCLSDLHLILLKSCFTVLSQEEFSHLINNIRKIGL